ncbi:hypothetical protein I4L69_001939 [Enterococcus faecium]|nr:hypothetical protein [Enterococcus faecium]
MAPETFVFPSKLEFENDIDLSLNLVDELVYPFEAAIIPKYINDNMYYLLKLEGINEQRYIFQFQYVSYGKEILLWQKELTSLPSRTMAIRQEGSLFTITIEEKAEKIEHNAISNGMCGYAITDEAIKTAFTVSIPKLKDWSFNSSKIDDQQIFMKRHSDNYFEFANDSTKPLVETTPITGRYLFKKITLDPEKSYILSYDSDQSIDVGLYAADSEISRKRTTNKAYFLIEKQADIELRISKYEPGTAFVGRFQLEEGTVMSPYTPTESTQIEIPASIASIPQKNNIDRASGSLLLEIELNGQESFQLISVGEFTLSFSNAAFHLASGTIKAISRKIELPSISMTGKVQLLWTWEDNSHKLCTIVNGEYYEMSNFDGQMNGDFGQIELIGNPIFTGEWQSLIISKTNYLYKMIDETVITELTETKENQLFAVDFSDHVTYKQKPFLEGTLAPLDGSPILVSDDEGQMRRHNFFDPETGKFRPYNEEIHTYKGVNELRLGYDRLDENFRVTVKTTDGEIVGEPLSIEGHLIKLTIDDIDKRRLYGQDFIVTYQLERSYTIEFNETAALDSYEVHFANFPNTEIAITQEGNRFSNKRLSKEIELNPIINPRHKGFLYIVQNKQEANGFRMNISSDMIHANGIDSADVIVEVIDGEGNEILSPYIDMYLVDSKGNTGQELGTIAPVVSIETLKARNAAGRLYYRYNSPYLFASEGREVKTIYVVAYDRLKKIGIQVPLVLGPTTEDQRRTAQRTLPEANLSFEYFARYYERNDIPAQVLNTLDYDKNQQLTYEDFEIFLTKQYSMTDMQQNISILKELEAN